MLDLKPPHHCLGGLGQVVAPFSASLTYLISQDQAGNPEKQQLSELL